MDKKAHKIFHFALPMLMILSILSACAEKPATSATFENIGQYKDGTKVTLTGYLDLYNSFESTMGSDYSPVRLRDANDERDITVWIEHKDYEKDTQPNRMKSLLLLYDESSLMVWLNNGTEAGFGSKVKITGTLRFTDDGHPFIYRVTKIE